MSFLNGNKTPIGYGAIMHNGSTSGIEAWYPFFTSHADLGALLAISTSGASGTINISDIDDYWTVMPGYKLEVYNNPNYTIILLTGDNTNGTTPINYVISPRNVASSLKLYYKNVIINQPNPVRVTANNFSDSYVVAYNSINYRVYEYYAGSTGTLSFSASSTISSVECLLIGGGGSGAHNNGANIGVGGGGAGAFLTTTIPVTAGDTFTISVGAGGAAPSVGFAGNVGSGTSIQRTTGGNPSTLTAGGGGGGGGGGNAAGGGVTSTANYQGTKGTTIWGSTGGVCPYLSSTTTAFTTSASNAFTQTSAVFGTVTSSVFAGGSVTWVNYMGDAFYAGASGGGGAGGVGGNNGGPNTASGGAGGAGKTWALTGSRLFAGGGGGLLAPIGVGGSSNGAAGSGGGGAYQVAVTENTGSGGGAGYTGFKGKGANGICIIAVPV